VSTNKFTLSAHVGRLKLKEPFTIARKSWDEAENVFVALSHDGTTGWGEVSPDDRWGDTPSSVVRELEALDLTDVAGPFDLEGLRLLCPANAARCALDIAMHDLAAKSAGISVSELLGLGGRPLPVTSVTVAITDVDRMVERARGLADHPVLKMKVGFDGDVDAVAAVREVYDGLIRIDANEGWDVSSAVDRLNKLGAHDIELCEQPIPAGAIDDLRRVTESSPIPVFADEDVGTADDVAKLTGSVHGVNLKLRKTGGIREFVRAVAVARAHGMQVMIGCDLETGIGATAQAHVAPLADYADIDGPLLLAEDPHPGVRYERGVVTLPAGPGLGVREPK
jgi:L-Ala-D/L-Glu epimerase / N-acetyl-D-glutamate racemase